MIAAIAAWSAIAAIWIVIDPPLGHDEAAFALAARDGRPPGGWLYRSDGTVAVARLGLALGDAGWQLRLSIAVLAMALVAAAFAVGRAASSARAGAWAAAVIAGAHPIAVRGGQLLSDLPAAAALLGGIAVLVSELDRAGGPRWSIVAAAPLFASAFYLRYGSAPAIVLALAAAAIVWWQAIRARPGRAVAVVAVLGALLVPHLVRSLVATGSVLGILRISAGMPRRAYFGEGLVTYLTHPLQFYGVLAAPLMIAGIVGLARCRRRAPWYLAIVALGQITALGLQSHAQPRYVIVATVLLVVVGIDAVMRATWWPARPGLAVAGLVAAWLVASAVAVVAVQRAQASRAAIVRAAEVIRADAAGRPCTAVAEITPQLAWYTRCEVVLARLGSAPGADHARYAVSLPRAPLHPAQLPALAALRATPLATGDPELRIWRLE